MRNYLYYCITSLFLLLGISSETLLAGQCTEGKDIEYIHNGICPEGTSFEPYMPSCYFEVEDADACYYACSDQCVPNSCEEKQAEYSYAYGECPEGTLFEPDELSCKFDTEGEDTCYFSCEKACVEAQPEPVSCDDFFCVGVEYELEVCPPGEEQDGEICSCSLLDDKCEKSCSPICVDIEVCPDFAAQPIIETELPTEPSPGNGGETYHIAGRLGDFDVNARGEFVYAIPLDIPQGTAGVQPNLSIAYNSGGFDGSLGIGWSLSAGSVITRCSQRKDIDTDEVFGTVVYGVNYDWTDRYCIDNQRLILMDGKYGEEGSTYRLENDNLTIFTAHDNFNNQLMPHSFTAKLPNGNTMYYGSSKNSRRHFGNAKISEWALDKLEDSDGNYISYRYLYEEESTELLLSKIKYTGFKEQQCSYNKIEFIYGDKPNPKTAYKSGLIVSQSDPFGGHEDNSTHQLKRVEMYDRGYKVWGYQLDYTGRPDRAAQLASVQKCYGEELTKCDLKTEFEWNNENFNGVTFSQDAEYMAEGLTSHVNNELGLSELRFGDFDGNGLTDIYKLNPTIQNGGDYYYDHIYLNYYDKESKKYKFRKINGLPSYKYRAFYNHDTTSLGRLIFMDFNGDKRTDIYLIRGLGENPEPDLDNPWDVYSYNQDLIFLFDVPLNGLDEEGDIIEIANFKIVNGIKSVVDNNFEQRTHDFQRLKFADFNDDGRIDVYYNQGNHIDLTNDAVCLYSDDIGYQHPDYEDFAGCNWQVKSHSGDAFPIFADPPEMDVYEGLQALIMIFSAGLSSTIQAATAAHAYAVGKSVALYAKSAAQAYAVGKIMLFLASQVVTIIEKIALDNTKNHYGTIYDFTRLGDFNGDGLMDIYVAVKGAPDHIYFSALHFQTQNKKFYKVEVQGLNIDPSENSMGESKMPRYLTGDFNGDGNTDIYSQWEEDLIYLSRGTGFFTVIQAGGYNEEDDMPDIVGPIHYVTSQYKKFSEHLFISQRLADFDADGYTDIHRLQPTLLKTTWEEVESGRDTIAHWLGDESLGYQKVEQDFGAVFNPYYGSEYLSLIHIDRNRHRYGDFNGDGMLDLYVIEKPNSTDKIYYNRNIRPLITKVSHEKHLGGDVLVEYKSLTNPEVYTTYLPNDLEETPIKDDPYHSGFFKYTPPLPIVSQIKTSLVNTKTEIETSYQGANYFYQGGRVEHNQGFLGFRKVISESFVEYPQNNNNQDKTRTTTLYHQLRPFSGKPEKITVERMVNDFNFSEKVISETINKWSTLDNLDLGKRKFAYLEKQEVTNYHPDLGNNPPTKKIINEVLEWEINEEFDYWFPTVNKTQVFDGWGNKPLNRTLVETTYQHDTDKWQLGLPKQIDTYVDFDDIKGGVDEKWQRVINHYDVDNRLKSNNSYYEKDNVLTLYLTEDYEWDQYGNLITTETYGEEISYEERRRQELEYTQGNETGGRYLETTRNSYGHESKILARDPFFGIPVLTENANQRQFVTLVGQTGQIYKYWNDIGNWGLNRYFWCKPNQDCTYRHSTSSNDMPVNYVAHYDEYGRSLFDTIDPSGMAPNEVIYANTVRYDDEGRVLREYGPKWAEPLNEADSDLDRSEYEYDDLGRIIRVFRYGNNWPEESMNYRFSGFFEDDIVSKVTQTISTEDESDYKKEIYYNALGQIVKVLDYINGAEVEMSYEYDALGNMVALNAGFNMERIWEYDDLGRQISMQDSSLGNWYYRYNGFGEIIEQTDGNGQITTTQYDRLGRVKELVDGDGITTWYYDTKELGELDYIERFYDEASLSDVSHYVEEYNYNNKGLLSEVIHKVDQVPYSFKFQYYNANRLNRITYPDGFKVKYRFSNNFGHIDQVGTENGSSIYWQVDAEQGLKGLDLYGRVLHERVGLVNTDNYLYRSRQYHQGEQGNQVKAIQTWLGDTNTLVQDMSFNYDVWGAELESRHDHLLGLNESYTYDAWSRLKTNSGAKPDNASHYSYDSYGRMFIRSVPNSDVDIMQYVYPQRPFLLYGLGAAFDPNKVEYTYDDNGNMLSKVVGYPDSYPARLHGWTSFNKPRFIDVKASAESPTTRINYSYDAGGDRLYQATYLEDSDTPVSHRLTLGMYEELYMNGEWRKIHYIPDGDGQIAVQRITVGNDVKHQVLLRDHLGSVVQVHDVEGDDTHHFNYGPYGERRQGDDWSWPDYLIGGSDIVNRGYTGHVPADEEGLQLIDMNARFYDPEIGRFISADTILPDPFSTQAIDPYGYVYNNPMTLIDPTGHVPDCAGCYLESIDGTNYLFDSAGNNMGQFLPDITMEYSTSFNMVDGMLLDSGGQTTISYTLSNTFDIAGNGLIQPLTPIGPNLDSVINEPDLSGRIGAYGGHPAARAFAMASRVEHALDYVQTGMGILGMIPGAGAYFDAINCIISCARGNYDDALMDLSSFVPGPSGWASGSANIARRSAKIAKFGKKVKPALPALDSTGKVHGKLPRSKDLKKYSKEELIQLRGELKKSVKQRIKKNIELGSDRAHGQRQANEQQLIKSIDKILRQ